MPIAWPKGSTVFGLHDASMVSKALRGLLTEALTAAAAPSHPQAVGELSKSTQLEARISFLILVVGAALHDGTTPPSHKHRHVVL